MKTLRIASAMFLSIVGLSAFAVPSASAGGWVSFGSLGPAGVDNTEPQTVIDSNNQVTVAWKDDTSEDIMVSTRPPGGSFSAPQVIPSDSGGPQIGVASSGETILVWRTSTTVDYAIRPVGGSSFGAAQTIPASAPATDPALAVAPNGAAFVVYESATLYEYSYRPPGGSFVGATQVPGTNSANEYSIAASANGSGYITWEDSGDIGARQIQAGGALGNSFTDVTGADFGDQPDIGMDQSGNPSIAYKNTVSLDVNVVRIVGAAAGSPVGLTGTGVIPANIQETTTASGSSHVVWTNTAGPVGSTFAQARRVTAGGTLGQFQTPLSATPAAVLDAEGNSAGSVLALWQLTSGNAVQGVAAGDAQPFGGAATVGGSNNGSITASTYLADNTNGSAAWSNAGSPSQVLAAAYDNTPPTLSNVNIPSSGTQLKPSTFSAQASDPFFLNGPVSWNFGDGKTASGDSVAHTYAKPGTFTVTVTTTDTAGNSASNKQTIKVASGPSAIGSVTSRKLKLARNGRISVAVRCSASAVATCRGTLFLKSAKKVKISRKKTLSIGQSSYSIKQGKSGKIKIKAKRSARRYINRKRKLSTRVSITGRDGFGKTVVRRYKMTTRK